MLAGVGHTHAHIVREWGRRPIPGVRLVCVSDFPVATYSGMLPGVLAGDYRREAMEIDLGRLCQDAGATLILGTLAGLERDGDGMAIRLADGATIPFDALSIGIGSTTADPGGAVVPIKPMTTFLDRLAARLRGVGGDRPPRIAVVGGGAGGVEIAFCVRPFAERVLGADGVAVTLIHAGEHLEVGDAARLNDRAHRRLNDRGVAVRLGRPVVAVADGRLTLAGGETLEADVILWATGADAPAVLGTLGLPTDDRGFLATRPTLQTTADLPIFAVGDTGTIVASPAPKAGVYAVREGPILWRNLRRLLAGRPLRPYRPQSTYLKLLNTGDGRAIGEYRGFTAEGRWCRWLKDAIDRRFIRQYQK